MTVLPRLPFLSRQRRQDWKEVKEEDSSKNKFKYRKQERDNLNDAERLQEYEQIFRRIDDYKRLEKENQLPPRKMISISRAGMRVRMNSPLSVETLERPPSREAIMFDLHQPRRLAAVNLYKYPRHGMTLKEMKDSQWSELEANGKLPKIVDVKNFASSRSSFDISHRCDARVEVGNNSNWLPSIDDTTGTRIKKINEMFARVNDEETAETVNKLHTSGQITSRNTPLYTNKNKESATTTINSQKSQINKESQANFAVNNESQRKVFSYNEYGEIVELMAPPRLCYGFASTNVSDDELRKELISYRHKRLIIERYGEASVNKALDVDHALNGRESAEMYMYNMNSSGLKKPNKPPAGYKPTHRDTGFTPTSSYRPWTVDPEAISTLSRLVWKGKISKVKEYLKEKSKHAKINNTDSKGRSALHFAASWGCLESLDVLLKIKGIKLNEIDEDGKTPLYKAAEKGSFSCVKRLVQAGADPYVRCLDGRDALEQLIFDHGDCHIELITYLYLKTKKKRSNEKFALTLLHKVALVPRDILVDRVIRMLIKHGENINALDVKLRTPMILAAMRRRDDLVIAFLKQGADAGYVDHFGKAAQDYAEPDAEMVFAIRNHIKGYYNDCWYDDIQDTKDGKKVNGCGRSCCNRN